MLYFIVALCPKSWFRGLHGSCFKLFSGQLVWTAAKSACSGLGARLAVLNSQGLKLKELQRHALIGLHRDPKDSSRWLWIDGSRGIYPKWSDGEPNDVGGREDCVVMLTSGKLNDLTCIVTRPYFCEISRKLQLI